MIVLRLLKEPIECNNLGAKGATRSDSWWGEHYKWSYQNGLINF